MPPRRKAPSVASATFAAMKKDGVFHGSISATYNVTPSAPPSGNNKRKATTIIDLEGNYHDNVQGADGEDDIPFAGHPTATHCGHHHHSTTDPSCLHCHTTTTDIQVRCDECSSYICNSCHWCHEFQANHELKVCDRCDAFYCRHCDEMDQCDDCGEVVCASCSTLLSCKFCGGGLCEDCATACGRCGIVLCSRDAKFAVDCDTCRLSYCLVCLASGSKDPCVRCGHRPSKRMEQLVHLRLKSIYKAFKQSSNSVRAAANVRDRQNDDPDETHMADDPEALFHAAATAAKNSFSSRAGRHRSSQSHHHGHDAAEPPSESSVQDKLEQYMAKKEKADAAAAELLAELEEEEEAAAKKKKSKKKKEKKKSEQPINDVKYYDEVEVIPHDVIEQKPVATHAAVSDIQSKSALTSASAAGKEAPKADESRSKVDPMEELLCELVADSDTDGLEHFLNSLKGIPGKAILRKNAKKALKRLQTIKDELETLDVASEDNEPEARFESSPSHAEVTHERSTDLLKIVSLTHGKLPTQTPGSSQRKGQPGNVLRSECVMHMSPTIVGWVIGKGGQRIRDLMEESGARIWIDQESMATNEPRIVYCSGARKSVEAAMKLVTDLVSRAPVGTHGMKHVASIGGTSAVKSPLLTSKGPEACDTTSSMAGFSDPLPSSQHKFAPPSQSRSCHVILCDPRFVPLLIGRRGWTIKNIQDSSGAKVDIDQTVTPRRITVSGSESQVNAAVKMVNDVLDYPQSQIQGPELDAVDVPGEQLQGDPIREKMAAVEVALPIAEREQARVHSPPPSSLVMPTDAASASSSLSSTPEPSMASYSTGGLQFSNLPPGPMLPPAMNLQHNGSLAARTDLALNVSDMNDGLPHARLPSCLLTPSRTTFRDGFYESPHDDLAARTPVISSRSPAEDQRNFDRAHQLFPTAFASHVTSNHGLTSHPAHTNMVSPPFQQNHPHIQFAGLAGLPGAAAVPTHAPNMWPNTIPSLPRAHGIGTGQPKSNEYHLDAAVDFLHNSTAPTPASSVPGLRLTELPAPGARSTSGIDSTLGVNDSEIVDSLFGPWDTLGGGSSLLTGLERLSISEDPTPAVGIWGAASLGDQDLAGLRPLGGFEASLETPIQHPSQSRFAWGGFGNE